MTKRLFDAISAYAASPTGYNRERGMTLIAEGHLDHREVERLEWAPRTYCEKVAKTA
jgi:hypothetical protein